MTNPPSGPRDPGHQPVEPLLNPSQPAFVQAEPIPTPGTTVPVTPVTPVDDPGDDEASTTDVAKQEASAVGDTAAAEGRTVVESVKDESRQVLDEAKTQAKDLAGQARDEVDTQVRTQQQNAASRLHALAGELGDMASSSNEQGMLSDLARQGAEKGSELATWLEDHEPRDVLHELQTFARRRPVAFLTLCGVAGFIAGRISRGAMGANNRDDATGGIR